VGCTFAAFGLVAAFVFFAALGFAAALGFVALGLALTAAFFFARLTLGGFSTVAVGIASSTTVSVSSSRIL
jgi:hypothetical protein